MQNPSLGGQELALLQFVTEHAPISMAQVAEDFGASHGWARATIHTMLERLRKKGYLTREKSGGVYQYRPCITKTELLTNVVGDFLQHTLGGSLRPFMAYLAKAKDLSREEVEELQALVKELDSQREGENHDG